MYTDYLKKTLGEIAAMKDAVARINADNEGVDGKYPRMCGALEATISRAAILASVSLKWTVDNIDVIEREHSRLISILEALDIELDEDALATLELIGKRSWNNEGLWETSPYKEQRRAIGGAVMGAIAEVQQSEREYERETADDAIRAAGFEFDEEEDAFRRGHELIRIELTDGRESRYKWEYDTSNPNGVVASGVSGDFSRLLELIGVKAAGV